MRARRFLPALWIFLVSLVVACNSIIGAELGQLRPDADGGSSGAVTGDGSVVPLVDGSTTDKPDSFVPVDFATIGGTVSGLKGTGLILKNNGADDLQVGKDGAFGFPAKVQNGSPYAVTVSSQPSNPTQTCEVVKGAGTVEGAHVMDIAVTCQTPAYTIGGRVTGLTGTGLVLTNNGEDLPVAASATSFSFTVPVASGSTFEVSIKTQPSSGGPCNVSGGGGTVGGTDVSSVVVNCTPGTYTVGGTIAGLNGTVILRNNNGDDRPISSNGDFAFATPIATGANYAVTVYGQPSYPPRSQTCTVASPGGQMGTSNVTTVRVDCVTNLFNVGGTLSGASGPVTLRNNGGDDLAATNGTFTFGGKIESGSTYAVSIGTAPPGQACSLTNETGTVGNGPIGNVSVSCADVSAASITLVNKPTDPSNATAFNFTFTITGATGAAQCKLDRPGAPGTFGPCDTNGSHNVGSLGDGNHTFTVQAVNAVGVPSTASYSWLVDKSPPVINFTSTPPNPSAAASWMFGYTIQGATGNAQCRLDGPGGPGTFVSCNATQHTITTGPPGGYSFIVRATDGVNTTDATYSWSKCTPPPFPAPFGYTGAVATFTIPTACMPDTVRIEVWGAEGGSGGNDNGQTTAGGKGARMRGDFTGLAGVTLVYLVGQKGEDRAPPAGWAGGGGGGSFVWQQGTNYLFVAAGAGGGAGALNPTTGALHNGRDGVVGTSGTHSSGATSGGGTAGGGAVAVTDSTNNVWSGGGTGWLSNGAPGYANNVATCGIAGGGARPLAGGAGGQEPAAYTTELGGGGFGGGGASQGLCAFGGGGGGGGYSGGGGGTSTAAAGYAGGGGGGSFNAGNNPSNSSGVRAGNGQIQISW